MLFARAVTRHDTAPARLHIYRTTIKRYTSNPVRAVQGIMPC